jgi:hypothetical protein
MFGYGVRDKLFPGEDSYFRSNPKVSGMAAETGDVILNPYAPADVNKDAVARNEAFRLLLRDKKLTPPFDVTDAQRAAFNGTAYANDDAALRSTIAARIYSGDPSAQATPEQKAWVDQVRASGGYTDLDVNPQPQDAVLAGLAMAGTGFGRLGSRAVRPNSVAGAERAGASGGLPSHIGEAGIVTANAPEAAPVGAMTARAYRGTSVPEQWPPTNPRHDTFWASDSPDVAGSYTGDALKWGGPSASITPADMSFKNPMVVDAKGQRWDSFGVSDSNELARKARLQGHDGLVIQNVDDGMNSGGPLSTTYAALRPGTVKSSTTGETLFSNAPDAAPVGVLATSGLERMAADDALPRPRMETPSLKTIDPDAMHAERPPGRWWALPRNEDGAGDPYRTRNYVRQLDSMMDPQSEWSAGAALNSNPSSPTGLLPMAGGGGEFSADLRREAIALGLIESDNYLQDWLTPPAHGADRLSP